jgi:hypothetical protein
MKRLWLVHGNPSSGKSTLAKALRDEHAFALSAAAMKRKTFMRAILIAVSLLALAVTTDAGYAQDGVRPPLLGTGEATDLTDRVTPSGPETTRFCPAEPKPHTFEIREADPQIDKAWHDLQLRNLVAELQKPNTTVLLGPNVILDFSDALDLLPLKFATCVTLTSIESFPPKPVIEQPGTAGSALSVSGTPTTGVGPARTPHSLGPLLKFGLHSEDEKDVFLLVTCPEDSPPNDHVRISGFRLEGPSLGQQTADQFGILIHRCLDIEVSNMEIFGWGGAGVRVLDDQEGRHGPGQEPPNNCPGERIGRPEQVRIFNNYFHHNQHESERESVDCDCTWYYACLDWVWCKAVKGHAAGYGVDVHHGAWAQVYSNLFDVNRHGLAASGKMGGYDARWNLTLKGGGYHGRFLNTYTHQFDIHGTGGSGFGGQAGVQSWFFKNSFQYRNDNAIKIRGRPHIEISIGDNVFPHEGLENDWGDDAIALDDRDDLDVIKLLPGNVIDFDSYGRYSVCDFDGDGIDDLFLATGKTWWFSSFGEFPWSYLTERTERLDQVRLGYFDNDLRCDVVTESGGQWVIASGGTGPWTSIGSFGAPLAEVAFGQFDPNRRDHRPGATRRTTHAFRRMPDGEWRVTPLSAPNWQHVQSSSFLMSELRFGDFTGDGVTDVLAVNGGRWAISESARGSWRQLNPHLGDDVTSLFIADLDNNNIDDILKLKTSVASRSWGTYQITYTWYVSDDGRLPWRELKTYVWDTGQPILSGRAFAGRFGVAPGGGVVLTGPDRIGYFHSPAEEAVGASPDWRSLFSY